MLFDTGSYATFLLPRFLRDFPGMAAGAKKDSLAITGVTGSTETESLELEEIKLRVHGRDVIVRPARVLMKSSMRPSEGSMDASDSIPWSEAVQWISAR